MVWLIIVLVLLKELVANLENNFPRGVCSTYVVSGKHIQVISYNNYNYLIQFFYSFSSKTIRNVLLCHKASLLLGNCKGLSSPRG